MGTWLRRIRGGIVMGVLWAFAWALLAIPMELFIDPRGEIVDIWPMVLAIPGFLAGTAFAVLLAATERQRQFDELSLGRVAIWGSLAGLALGSAVVFLLARATPHPAATFPWFAAIALGGPITLLSAASAVGTLAIARKGEQRELLGRGEGDSSTRR